MKNRIAVLTIALCVAGATVAGSSLEDTSILKASAAQSTTKSDDETQEVGSEETEEVEEEVEETEDAEEAEDADATSDSDLDEDETVEDDASTLAEDDASAEDETEEADALEDEDEVEEETEEETEEIEETDEDEEEEDDVEEEESSYIAAGAAEGATVTVSGQGSVTVIPDMASIILGVQTTNESSEEAQTENSSAISDVTDALLDAGVSESDIQTTSYDIYSSYDYSNGSAELTGYTVSTILSISSLDTDEVGELIDAAVKAGANVVDGISYEYSDAEGAYDQALETAIERAQDKAEQIAEKAGAKLGNIVSISEEESSYGNSDVRTYDAISEDSSSLNVFAGQTSVSASVSVTYELIQEDVENLADTEESTIG